MVVIYKKNEKLGMFPISRDALGDPRIDDNEMTKWKMHDKYGHNDAMNGQEAIVTKYQKTFFYIRTHSPWQ